MTLHQCVVQKYSTNFLSLLSVSLSLPVQCIPLLHTQTQSVFTWWRWRRPSCYCTSHSKALERILGFTNMGWLRSKNEEGWHRFEPDRGLFISWHLHGERFARISETPLTCMTMERCVHLCDYGDTTDTCASAWLWRHHWHVRIYANMEKPLTRVHPRDYGDTTDTCASVWLWRHHWHVHIYANMEKPLTRVHPRDYGDTTDTCASAWLWRHHWHVRIYANMEKPLTRVHPRDYGHGLVPRSTSLRTSEVWLIGLVGHGETSRVVRSN